MKRRHEKLFALHPDYWLPDDNVFWNEKEYLSVPGWYTPKTKKITLEPFGQPDLYVEFLDLKSLDSVEADRIRNLAKGEAGAEDNPLVFVVELIRKWHITHPGTGEPLRCPTAADLYPFRVLPQEVQAHLASGMTEMLPGGAEVVPPENGTNSGMPS